MNGPLIALRGVTKRYGSFVAVNDVSLAIDEGSICGLLGPNGAGKTTTFKCLLGFARPNTGSVEIDGARVGPQTFEQLAYVPERPSLYDRFTIAQHLAIHRRAYKKYESARATELLSMFELDPAKKVGKLSKGMKTAVALVLAFAIRPRVLILDEPASGLDPIHQRHVLDLMIDAAANGSSVLFSSHQVGQVERAADRVAIMNKGRLVVDRVLDELKTDEKIIEVIFPGSLPDIGEIARDPRVIRTEINGSLLRVVTNADTQEIAQRIFALGPKSLRIIDLNLEDIFMNAVTGDTQ